MVAALLSELIGDIQEFIQIIAEQYLAARSLDFCNTVQRTGKIRAQLGHLSARLLQQRPRSTALLVEQRRHEMHRLDELIVAAYAKRLGIRQCRLKFGRQLVHSHRNSLEIAL